VGQGLPVGHTVMNDEAVTSASTITFSSTDTADAGTGAPARWGAGEVNGNTSVAAGPRGEDALTPTPGAPSIEHPRRRDADESLGRGGRRDE
jgi:hypothetical protein